MAKFTHNPLPFERSYAVPTGRISGIQKRTAQQSVGCLLVDYDPAQQSDPLPEYLSTLPATEQAQVGRHVLESIAKSGMHASTLQDPDLIVRHHCHSTLVALHPEEVQPFFAQHSRIGITLEDTPTFAELVPHLF